MRGYLKFQKNWLPLGLSALLCFNLFAPPAVSQAPPKSLGIAVVDGEGTVNHVRQRLTRNPTVRVEDENSRPLMGAAVAFTLPVSGTSGEFSNGSKTQTVITGKDGLATAQGIRSNQIAGKFPIHINASYRGLTARVIVTQFNMAVPGAKTGGGGNGKLVAILLIIGGAAAGGAVAATRKSGNSTVSSTTTTATVTQPISITPGTGTIGPPR
jgi:hypothetical protein